MTELRYWYKCPECGVRVWTSHHDSWAMEAHLPHCPTCGTNTHHFIYIGLARAKWKREGWHFSRVLIDTHGDEIAEPECLRKSNNLEG